MTRLVPALVSVGLLGATLWPLARDPADDSFPLSTYPMFTTPRPTQVELAYAIAETAAGARRDVTPSHLGTGEVMQAHVLVEGAVARGRGASFELCREIARRVAADGALADAARVRIVVGRFDAVAYLVDDAPGKEREVARCEVPR